MVRWRWRYLSMWLGTTLIVLFNEENVFRVNFMTFWARKLCYPHVPELTMLGLAPALLRGVDWLGPLLHLEDWTVLQYKVVAKATGNGNGVPGRTKIKQWKREVTFRTQQSGLGFGIEKSNSHSWARLWQASIRSLQTAMWLLRLNYTSASKRWCRNLQLAPPPPNSNHTTLRPHTRGP